MLTSLLAFVAFGTLWFWLIVAGFIIAITWYSEKDGVAATVTLVIGAIFLQFIAKYDLALLILGQPLDLLFYAGLYALIGFVYACLKWWRYAKKQRHLYDTLRAQFIKSRNIASDTLTAREKQQFLSYLRDHYRPNTRDYSHYSDGASDSDPVTPDITKNKSAFIRWMMYWPLNLCYTLLNDPVRQFFEWLYETTGKRMQAIADGVFRGTERDRLTKEEDAELKGLSGRRGGSSVSEI